MSLDIHEAIEVRAYFLFLNEGRPEGHALDHWLTAERETVAEQESLTNTAISAEPVEPVETVEQNESIMANHPVASVAIMGVIGGLVGGPIGAIAGVAVGAVGASIQTATDHVKQV